MSDNQFRKRDPDFKNVQHYKNKPVDRKGTLKGKKYFQPSDFKYNPEKEKLICPTGNELYVKNRNFKSSNDLKGITCSGKKTDCRGCSIRKKYLRSDMSEQRQVVIFTSSLKDSENYTSRMIKQFDT